MAIGFCKVCGRVVKSSYSHGRGANSYPALCNRHRTVPVNTPMLDKTEKRSVTLLLRKVIKVQGRRSPPTS